MNTHPKLVTDRELKLAETLRSFSLQPVSHDIEPPKREIRRLVLFALVFALISGTAIGIAVYRPDLAGRIETIIAAPPNSANRADDDVSVPDDANVHQGGEQSAVHVPVPAVREITGSGFVVAPRMTTVFSKYEGRITQVSVEAGDVVVAGQVLVTLDDAGARFALEQAKAAKSAAELQFAARTIDLSQARNSMARIETLTARQATSRQALEEAQAAFDRASNALAQARQSADNAGISIRIAEERLDEFTVRAPFAGTVARLDANAGDTVLARVDSVRESQSLLTITDTTSMVVDADIAETYITALRTGRRGEAVLDGFPDRPFDIEILRLAPVASAEKGTITVRFSLDRPPKGIRPNMAARIRIPLDDTGDMIP
ncbi:efflux RND transporter periplasmic adaptor subunit [Neorhizobium lilium]|uniref:Efflux RND transporter periplasmic adaptor subunit n=1 Tax=Neorhizobium lilium TaxID=2503024 RepID=A0A444LMT3_9HYPH|nr:efflux RND transporter periplasmic adaptor subunit [Neorhizobium lilium]RWX81578.1 efflux RND transporter periplasmic adaptor subunit [Neorhizobium lilium]